MRAGSLVQVWGFRENAGGVSSAVWEVGEWRYMSEKAPHLSEIARMARAHPEILQQRASLFAALRLQAGPAAALSAKVTAAPQGYTT